MDDVRIAVGSARLACTVGGRGPLMVFLHAGVCDRRSFAGALATFSASHRVAAWDRRGFGDTIAPPEPHSPIADLLAVVDTIGPPSARATLVGNSMGGGLALDFALAHPHRVERLVLVAPGVRDSPEIPLVPEALEVELALEAAEKAGDVEAENRLAARVWLDGWQSPEGRVGGEARALFLDMNRRHLTAPPVGEVLAPASTWSRLPEIVVPTTVILGALDLPHVNEWGQMLARAVKNGRVVVLDDVAHLPSLEAPARFDEALG